MNILNELNQIEKLKEALKVRAMVYQAGAKEKLALSRGLSKETYYYIAYEDWLKEQQFNLK